MTSPVLEVRSLSVGFGARTILRELSFTLSEVGITALMGAAGSGKSTILRTLGRRAEQLPSFWFKGEVRFGDRDLLRDIPAPEARRAIVLFGQKARLYTANVTENLLAACEEQPRTQLEKRTLAHDVLARTGLMSELEGSLNAPVISLPLELQRRLTLARITTADPNDILPHVILIDEPLRDLPEGSTEKLGRMLREIARTRALLLVTHDQRVTRHLAQRVMLLGDGRVVADCPVEEFFERPPNQAVQTFLRTGSYWPAEPEPAAPVEVARPEREPSGFHWIVPQQLAGMARPGLLHELDDDLAKLRGLGIHTVVTLEESRIDPDLLAKYELTAEHVPIADMGAPTLAQARALCQRTVARLARGEATVYHCRAGLGRTGTLLGCYLIFTGMSAPRALDEIRAVSSLYVQSTEQLSFLEAFEAHCRA
ncbi:ATP-binding cassette domain-containing protein [Haliangium sp.]|uniref:phosphatase domain-containing putative toxin n=1 Tax=Haliangium sp. TaxID=2663208 RepID=UPI003D112B49